MGHEPSLFHLFSRSRYTRRATPGASGRLQRELFAVAALGFVLKHDERFRKFFLREFLKADSEDSTDKFVCQDDHCADFTFVSGKIRWVIEAKVHVGLARHQDPRKKEFFKEKVGYGWKLRERFKGAKWINYVVLQKDPELRGRDFNEACEIKWEIKAWRDLVPEKEEESKLVTEFLNTLGEMNIPHMTLRILKRTQNARHTSSSARMFKILQDIGREMKVGRRNEIDWAVHVNSSGEAFFGINITNGAPSFSKLRKVSGAEKELGWLGFEAFAPRERRRSIWIYPKKEKINDAIRFLKRQGIESTKKDDSLLITDGKEEGRDDVDWFREMLKKLQDP